MKTILFQNDIWLDEKYSNYSTILLNLLSSKDILIVLKHGVPPYEIVFGVPHQAKVGEKLIAENWINSRGERGRGSDENAASFALVAFSMLRNHGIPCKLVIAAHATDHDPNKIIESSYCKEIFSEGNRLLFECHGAKEKRRHELELSAGDNLLSDALEFGYQLAKYLDYKYTLAVQTKSGTVSAKKITRYGIEDTELTLPAIDTFSLYHAGIEEKIPALHLEAKPRFRFPEDGGNAVSPDGFVLGKAIAEVILSKVIG